MEAEPLTADEIAEIRALDIDNIGIEIAADRESFRWYSIATGEDIECPLAEIPRLLATIAARDAEIERLREQLRLANIDAINAMTKDTP